MFGFSFLAYLQQKTITVAADGAPAKVSVSPDWNGASTTESPAVPSRKR